MFPCIDLTYSKTKYFTVTNIVFALILGDDEHTFFYGVCKAGRLISVLIHTVLSIFCKTWNSLYKNGGVLEIANVYYLLSFFNISFM